MRKIKCDDCSQYHQGFHLCPGPDAPPELRKQDYVWQTHVDPSNLGKAAGPKARWAAHHITTQERDRKIVRAYDEGYSFQQVGDMFGFTKTTIRAIYIRMGGTPRKSQGRPRPIKKAS